MKILIIDDSNLSRNMLKRALGEQYDFVEAENGMRGLELYYLEKPDLVILDLTMPGVNGIEVLQQIKQLDPQARVIVGTADVQDMTRRQVEQLGAAAYLQKPFTSEKIQAAVQQAIDLPPQFGE